MYMIRRPDYVGSNQIRGKLDAKTQPYLQTHIAFPFLFLLQIHTESKEGGMIKRERRYQEGHR